MALRDAPPDLGEHRLGAAAARRRRARAGSTQKAHEKEQPSWIFTNARTRSSRASAWTQPIAPTSPATAAGVSSLRPRDDDDVRRQAGERVAGEVRAAAGHVDARVRARGPRGRLARLRTASCVTQQVLTTATSPRRRPAPRGRRRAAARAPPARRCARPCSRGSGPRTSPSAPRIYSARRAGRPPSRRARARPPRA